jgi:phosphoesterase RecJ-like protein
LRDDDLKKIVEKIRKAKSVILTTHRQSDGDGLGAQIACYHALLKIGKKVRILNVDAPPAKYDFLDTKKIVTIFGDRHDNVSPTDLCLIFDTNDKRLLAPLYSVLEKSCQQIIFIDHHPILVDGPLPTSESLIDVSAASTGEIAYNIICDLNIAMDKKIARAIYTSIVFDTQNFRYIRSRPESHRIAAHLLEFERKPEEVHRYIFGNHSVGKLQFLADSLKKIDFLLADRLAILQVTLSEMNQFGLNFDDIRDVVDMIMNIESLEAAVLIREDAPDEYKISIRSKGQIEVLPLAEVLGGGGHRFASGAHAKDSIENVRRTIINHLSSAINGLDRPKS